MPLKDITTQSVGSEVEKDGSKRLILSWIQWRLVADLIGWADQYFNKLINPPKIINIIIRAFCPRAGLSLQTQALRLKFCPKAGLPPQT